MTSSFRVIATIDPRTDAFIMRVESPSAIVTSQNQNTSQSIRKHVHWFIAKERVSIFIRCLRILGEGTMPIYKDIPKFPSKSRKLLRMSVNLSDFDLQA